jgi:hypothetical protein
MKDAFLDFVIMLVQNLVWIFAFYIVCIVFHIV